jgi:hypothetical protein
MKTKTNPKPEIPMDFKEALTYLQEKGFRLTAWSLRIEVREYPERLGVVRRNVIKKRGRGGKMFFYKSKLDAYSPFHEVQKGE